MSKFTTSLNSSSMRAILVLFFVIFLMNDVYSQNAKKSSAVKAGIDSMFRKLDVGNFTKAEEWLEKTRMLIEEDPNQKDLFRFRYGEGIFHLKRWELETAEPILLECLELARESADSGQLLMANAVMSELMAGQSLYGSSIVYGNEALSYNNSTDSIQYYALTSNMAISYRRGQDTEKALQYAMAAMDFYQRKERFLELGLILNNIGELYREQFKDYIMAVKYYRKAMEINKAHGFKSGLSANFVNLALAFDEGQQMDSALFYINHALILRDEMGDVGGLAIVYNTLGQISLHNEKFLDARKAFSETIRLSKEHKIYPGIYYGNLGLGETYFAQGAYRLAETYFEKALETAKMLESKPMMAQVNKSLSELNREDGDYKAALDHFETYSAYSDSIRMEEKENEFADLRTRYETDLAHKENMILKANQLSQNAELEQQRLTAIGLWLLLGLVLFVAMVLYVGYKRRSKSLEKEAELHRELKDQHQIVQVQKEELKELDDLKNNIFSVLGHDLKAPLINISSLVGLINSGDLTPEEFTKFTHDLDQETKACLTSLQNILVWSQAKTGSGKLQIEEVSVASEVKEFLRNNQRKIEDKELQVSTVWDSAQTINADRNQFKSIVFNLVSNAIKFSPKGGKISMRTVKDSKGVYFTVSNAGLTISEELISRINDRYTVTSTRGTEGEKGTGIGLRIVNDFARLHGGTLKFRAIETGGTEAEVFFPFEQPSERFSA